MENEPLKFKLISDGRVLLENVSKETLDIFLSNMPEEERKKVIVESFTTDGKQVLLG